jgi:hypothetical protein
MRLTVNGHRFLPTGGHLITHWWPSLLPAGGGTRLLTGGCFRSTIFSAEIHASAREHGVADEDILHAVDHALATPAKILIVGSSLVPGGLRTSSRWWS